MNTDTDIRIDSTELLGKRVLVTGGTKGIGEAIATRLRQTGATVITTARSMPENLRSPDLFIGSDLSTPDGVTEILHQCQ
ncbi:MAG TPA: SDR family NAD(P)-dependent oxidoreductase [Leptolyngbyaceae cyanobacterium M33_DOE_097]|nr:SDR family NAD(P)-dependent oxidoreductase [Leptolyngbyaceae cyanobacterium M33_DOE_097]